MRNKILLFITLFLLIFVSINQNVYAQEEEKYIFKLEDKISILPDERAVYINSNVYLTYTNTNINIYASTGNVLIYDQYQCCCFNNSQLYLCSSNTLYIVNLNLLSYKTVNLNFEIKDINVDEYIYLVGRENNNPCIYVLNNDGDTIKNNVYEGDGYGCFNAINKLGDKYLITGEKDAFFENPEFAKVGNEGEIKSFIFIYDKTLKKVEDYYFNEYCLQEQISSIGIDNYINIILSTNNQEYLYIFDYELKLVKYIQFAQCNYEYIPNILGEVLLIYQESKSFKIGIYSKNEFKPIFTIQQHLEDYYVDNGVIALSYDNAINFYSEYHIDRCDTLTLTKTKYDYDTTSHFEVNSFFEKLTFKLDNYSPYHMHMMSGNYVATYKAKNTSGSEIIVKTDVVIKDFVNIIDGGVYNVNTIIQFFGDATLNGERINNGHSLKEEGLYELILTNVNGVKKIYHFEVVNDYYKDNDHYVIDVDYIVNKNDYIDIYFNLNNIHDIKYFVINGEVEKDFEIVDNRICLKIKSLSEFGYQDIIINGIVCNNNAIKINKYLSLLTRKEAPVLDISTNANDKYQIKINYTDVDNTFVDLYFIDKNANKKASTFLHNCKGEVNSGKFIICYELGDGVLLEEELLSLEGSSVKYDIEYLDDEIIINIYPNNSLKSINVNDKNIYRIINDNINLYIVVSTCISSLIIIFVCVLVLIIKRKRRKVNRI